MYAYVLWLSFVYMKTCCLQFFENALRHWRFTRNVVQPFCPTISREVFLGKVFCKMFSRESLVLQLRLVLLFWETYHVFRQTF